ncbi:MAG TPA: hypothetical protein VNA04_05670 [Thermoanaerobaculia bacterium]|nr:hypothetical protein [Thermoanaerobaculia bacterium]
MPLIRLRHLLPARDVSALTLRACPLDLPAVETGDGGLPFIGRAELDEPKPFDWPVLRSVATFAESGFPKGVASSPSCASHAGQSGVDVPLPAFLMLTPVIGIAGTALYNYWSGLALWMPLLALGMLDRGGRTPLHETSAGHVVVVDQLRPRLHRLA